MAVSAIDQRKQAQKLFDFIIDIWGRVTESVYDIALTIMAMAVMLSIYYTYWPALLPWATFTTGSVYAVLLLRRIVRKFDKSYTLDEIGERVVNMDHEINERLQEISRNV